MENTNSATLYKIKALIINLTLFFLLYKNLFTSVIIFPKITEPTTAPKGFALKIQPITDSLTPFSLAKGGKNGAIID